MFSPELIENTLARIQFIPADHAAGCLEKSDFVFECVPEVMDSKSDAFAMACQYLRDDAIIASTTSTFLSTDLAEYVSILHWANNDRVDWNTSPSCTVNASQASK